MTRPLLNQLFTSNEWTEFAKGNLTSNEFFNFATSSFPQYKEDITKILDVNYLKFLIPPYKETLDFIVELKNKGYNTNVGDEGGFAPNLSSSKEALNYIVEAINKSGYKPGSDLSIAIDVASSEFYEDGVYNMVGEGKKYSASELVEFYKELCDEFPIISIEDGMAEDDWEGWRLLTDELGERIQLVGDDLFVTNPKRLKKGIEEKIGNAVLIKVNQIGTLTEAMDAVDIAHNNNYNAILSHRSGETEDTSIADIAVATNCGQIKTGSLSRTDRVAKYNQLIRIEEELGDKAVFCWKERFL